jgi:hypothetical protein
MTDVTARPWWRWESMVGAVVTDYGAGVRIYGVTNDYLHGAAVETPANNHGPVWMRLRKERCTAVDTEDAATLGCLTQRARDLWGDPDAYVRPHSAPSGEVWTLHAMVRDGLRSERAPIVDADGRWISGTTEWAALVAACDAAPGRGA